MKIGITYLNTIYKYGYPPKIVDDFKALKSMREMGFHYLEMEGLGKEHTENVWDRRHDLKKCLDDNEIHIHNFCGVDPDLVSMDENIRKVAYESFKRTAELGVFFGTETLHLASYAPPVKYIGSSPYSLGEDYELGDTFQVSIPDGFNWNKVWDVLVESCQFTASVAKKYDRTIIMEPRVGEIICSADSMIRLINDVNMPNFKANFDTGHFSAQRENVILALYKLEGMYANIHIADNIPANVDHLSIGDGCIDWMEFFRVLDDQNYDGYLGLDLSGRDSLEKDLVRSAEFIENIANKLNIKMEK